MFSCQHWADKNSFQGVNNTLPRWIRITRDCGMSGNILFLCNYQSSRNKTNEKQNISDGKTMVGLHNNIC